MGRQEVFGPPRIVVIGGNAMQVKLVADMLNAFGLEAYGARDIAALGTIREDITHVLVLFGLEVVQTFRGVLLSVVGQVCSLETVFGLAVPECLREIVIGENIPPAA